MGVFGVGVIMVMKTFLVEIFTQKCLHTNDEDLFDGKNIFILSSYAL